MNNRFEIHENGLTVTDHSTGLMWPKNANLPEKPMSWHQAQKFIKTLNDEKYAGYNDWILPSDVQLLSLVDRSQYYPALTKEHPFENVQSDCYWLDVILSKCRRKDQEAQAYYVNLSLATIDCRYLYYRFYVWPVRKCTAASKTCVPRISSEACRDCCHEKSQGG